MEIDLLDTQNTLIETIAAAAPNSGSFTWTIPTALSSGQYTIRVTRSDGAGSGQRQPSSSSPPPPEFITSTTQPSSPADWTTAPGNNANTGLDAAHPKASISAILAAYQLSPGNIIMVDDGTYNVSSEHHASPGRQRDHHRRIHLTSSGNRLLLTTLNRGNINAGNFAFDVEGRRKRHHRKPEYHQRVYRDQCRCIDWKHGSDRSAAAISPASKFSASNSARATTAMITGNSIHDLAKSRRRDVLRHLQHLVADHHQQQHRRQRRHVRHSRRCRKPFDDQREHGLRQPLRDLHRPFDHHRKYRLWQSRRGRDSGRQFQHRQRQHRFQQFRQRHLPGRAS